MTNDFQFFKITVIKISGEFRITFSSLLPNKKKMKRRDIKFTTITYILKIISTSLQSMVHLRSVTY